MTKRPKLDSLPLATKPVPATSAAPAEASVKTATPAEVEREKGGKDDRVTLILRLSAEDRRSLKMISARDGRTVQDMLHDAVQDIIRRSK